MKNLNIKIIISLLFATIACNDDFMERYPLDKISDVTFWKSASDIKTYANQFYPNLGNFDYGGYLDFTWDDNSDNQGPATRNEYTWGLTVVPSSGGGWSKSDWNYIRKCNYALVRIEEMEKKPDVLMYEGEIRFFKTYYYFTMVKRFGDVPWLDKDLNVDSEELYGERISRKNVVNNMLADLDFAIEHLPETSEDLRLTKYAALAFKTELCLYEGTFRKYHNLGDYEVILREAVDAAEEIINSGMFEVYTTGKPYEDYFNLFVQYDLNGNSEAICYKHYITNVLMYNKVRRLGESYTGYTKDFVETFLCKDGLPISLSPLYEGDAVFGDEFENRDPRMWQSVYHPDRPYRIYDDGSIYYKPMPEFDHQYTYTGYEILKGYSPYEKDRQPVQDIIDLHVWRYGKVLIEYAEAKAELGEATQAVLDKSINLLRDRAGMPHLTVDVGFTDPNWPEWEIPVSPLINEIRRERRIELCAEGRRWDDLIRWKAGKLLEGQKTVLGARDPATDQYRVLYPEFERQWHDRLYLRPIPKLDLTLNPNLVQNPGWENL